MNNLKLTYFDFHGGRGEPIRIALHSAGIAFEDIRWSFADFGEKRQTLRFNAVPALEINGEIFTQSNAISRYVGKLANMYPVDPLQALYCDEVLGAMEDITHYLVQTFGLEGDVLKQARQELMNGRLTVFFNGLNELLKRGGGTYFADQRLTVADLKVFVTVRQFRSGGIDHIPAEFIDQLAPELCDHQSLMEKEPSVVAYYASVN